MLQYFPCTIKNIKNIKIKKTKASLYKLFGYKPKSTGSTVKPNDEKPGATEATKTSRSKSKGREKGKGVFNKFRLRSCIKLSYFPGL